MKVAKPLLNDYVKEIVAAPEKFTLNGRLDAAAIASHFNIGLHTSQGIYRMAKDALASLPTPI
jgi:hypothetical protein